MLIGNMEFYRRLKIPGVMVRECTYTVGHVHFSLESATSLADAELEQTCKKSIDAFMETAPITTTASFTIKRFDQ